MEELHSAQVVTALVPRYVSRFSCLGAACEDSCCTGWAVTLDRKTFEAYQQVEYTEPGSALPKEVRFQEIRISNAHYANIELDPETKECPFMEARLCAVQKNLGESYLSNTCFSYPRNSRSFAGQYETALTLSCPEAARQALLAEDAFDFLEQPVTLRPNAAAEVVPTSGMPVELMNEVRTYCIQLLKTRQLELWERLAVLGGFCEALTTALAQGRNAAVLVPALMADYVAIVENGLARKALADLQPDHAAQAQVFTRLWQCRSREKSSAAEEAIFDAVARGLGVEDETGQVTVPRLIENYGRGIARLHQALEAAPRLLEHYFLNEAFRTLFPLNAPSPYEHYLKLVSRLGLLRLMLAAQCNASASLPDAITLAKTVHVYCKRFQHDAKFEQRVRQALADSGWDRLEKLYRLLRA